MPLGIKFCKGLAAAGLGGESVIEIGSRPASGQEERANLRPIFNSAEYVGVDIQAGTGVDLVWDGEHIDDHYPKHYFELGVTIDTLEHTYKPYDMVVALAEVAVHVGLRAPFACPIHEHPFDFWRLTPSLVARILKELRPYGFSAQDPGMVATGNSTPDEWPNGSYGFATDNEGVRQQVLSKMPGSLKIIEVW